MAEKEVSANIGSADVGGLPFVFACLLTSVHIGSAVTYSLSHLLSVMEHLEPAWTRAFLRRTRFIDADFQGDVLAVICASHWLSRYSPTDSLPAMISSSLRTGNPLPQVTPCPLLDRFTTRHHGLDVIHRDSEDDYGLPRLLTLETLQNEQYMCVHDRR